MKNVRRLTQPASQCAACCVGFKRYIDITPFPIRSDTVHPRCAEHGLCDGRCRRELSEHPKSFIASLWRQGRLLIVHPQRSS